MGWTVVAERRRKIVMGQIDYSNVWPVFHYFPIRAFAETVEIVRKTPAGLNRDMREGRVDLGPMSSFAYGESFHRYLLLPGLSVSASGPVRSILFFYKRSLEEAINGRIAMTTTSATSVALLRIIIEKFYGGRPQYAFVTPSLHDMMETNDGALLIGDDAIRASWQNHGYGVMDLGEAWKALTGHTMTYALWGIRREAAERHPDLIADILRAFRESKRKGKTDTSGIIAAAVDKIGGTEDYWRRYFAGLIHDLGEREMAGLRYYYRLAAELNLLETEPELQFWHENLEPQVNE